MNQLVLWPHKNSLKIYGIMIKVQSQLKRYAEELDPVGQRDGDVNDDGRKDKTDEYIYNRRDAIKRAIAKKREKSGKKVSEGYASWRMDLNYFEEEILSVVSYL